MSTRVVTRHNNIIVYNGGICCCRQWCYCVPVVKKLCLYNCIFWPAELQGTSAASNGVRDWAIRQCFSDLCLYKLRSPYLTPTFPSQLRPTFSFQRALSSKLLRKKYWCRVTVTTVLCSSHSAEGTFLLLEITSPILSSFFWRAGLSGGSRSVLRGKTICL